MANTDKEQNDKVASNKAPFLDKLKELIASKESSGLYHNLNQGVSTSKFEPKEKSKKVFGKLITDMSMRELLQHQTKPKGDSKRVFASGKYQIVPNTMLDLMNRMKITEEVTKKEDFKKPDVFKFTFYKKVDDPTEDDPKNKKIVSYNKYYKVTDKNFLNAKYSPEMQEQLGNMLILNKRPKVAAYIRGDGSLDTAADELAKEFASLPDKTGNSKYGEVGKNKAYHKYEDVTKALEAAKKSYKDAPKEEKAYNALESIKNVYKLSPTPDQQDEGEEPKAPVEKPAPAPTPAPVSQKIQEEKPKKAQPSSVDSPKDYSDYPFKEAFNMARNVDKQKVFSWEGRLFTTMTGDDLLAKASKKEPEEPELPAKDGGVEDIFGGPIETPATRSSRLAQEPPEDTFDISPLKEDRMPSEELGTAKPSKISDILKKTTGSKYDTMSFDKAFAAARKDKKREFPWRGKSYHTKYKEEM